jgi:hypothetical protein
MRAATLATLVMLGCSSGSDRDTDAQLNAAGTAGAEQRTATGGRAPATQSSAGERSTGGEATGGTGAGGSAEAGAAGVDAGQAGESSTGGTDAAGGDPTGGVQSTGGIGSGGTSATGGRATGGTHQMGGSRSGGTRATGGSSTGGTASTGGTPTSGGTDAAGASGAAGQGTGGLVSTMPGVWGCDHELAVVCPTGCSLLGIDPRNCGECGNDITTSRWGEREVCVDGKSQYCPETSEGHQEVRCLTTCHDLRTDKQNCGACGNDCTDLPYAGDHNCVNGVCGG